MSGQSRVIPSFGEAVRTAMGGLSQSEAALRTQISVGYINRMVRGTVPSPEIILRLAAGLTVDAGPLLAAGGYGSEPDTSGRDDASEATSIDSLGPHAAAQEYRELWDRYILPAFPGADMPSGATLPLTHSGIRARIVSLFEELLERSEDTRSPETFCCTGRRSTARQGPGAAVCTTSS